MVRLLLSLVSLLALCSCLCLPACASAARNDVGPARLPARVVRMQLPRVPCLCCPPPLACRSAPLPCSAVVALPAPPPCRCACPCLLPTLLRSILLAVLALLPLLAMLRPPRVHPLLPPCPSSIGLVLQNGWSHRPARDRHHHGSVVTSAVEFRCDRRCWPHHSGKVTSRTEDRDRQPWCNLQPLWRLRRATASHRRSFQPRTIFGGRCDEFLRYGASRSGVGPVDDV